MKRIDFSNVNIEMELGVFQPRDVRSEFGNIVFQHAATLEQDTLARKIFNAPAGQITELADNEFDILTAIAIPSFATSRPPINRKSQKRWRLTDESHLQRPYPFPGLYGD